MPIPVQAIYRDIPGTLPATYDAPASLDVEFASSRIRFNGSAASGSFVIVLEALTNDGRIMVAARSDRTFAVGDTGVVSWAPFLRGQITAATIGFVGARIGNENGQSVPNSTNTDRHYDTVIFDTGGMANLGSNDRILTVPTTGWYTIASEADYANNTTGRRINLVYVNGYYAAGTGTGIASFSMNAIGGTGRTSVPVASLYYLTAGDFISTGTFQNSGGSLSEGGPGAGGSSYLAAALLGV